MDYEKKYKEALERARDYYKANIKLDNTDENLVLEDIMPELKESKDEKIRKAIYGWINTRPSLFFDDGFSKEQMLAWLEKQGKIDLEHYEDGENEKRKFVGYGFLKCKGDFLSFKEGETYWLEYIGKDNYNVRSDNLLGQTFHIKPVELYTVFRPTTWLEKQDKQNTDDKVEPKDYSSIDPHFGKPIDKQKPKFHEGDWVVIKANGHVKQIVRIEYFASGHPQYIFSDGLWFGNGTEARLWTIQDANPGDVLASKDGDNILIFRNLDTSTSFSSYYNIARKGELGWSNECFIPATKEQRDTLMKAMADAGYIFDFEKKKLKKIEQMPSWSEEDEEEFQIAIDTLVKAGQHDSANWLKSLKERVQPQWKPSGEQIKAIRLARSFVTDDFSDNPTLSEILTELEEQLKKLKGE